MCQPTKYLSIFESFGYLNFKVQKDRLLKLSAQLEACEILGFNIDYQPDRLWKRALELRKTSRETMKDVAGFPLWDPGPTIEAKIGSGFKGKTVCDVGCGNSPMSLIFAGMGANVYAVTWEPEDPGRQHIGVVENPKITLKTNVDYIKYSKENLKDSSVDLFLDGCSITHFIMPPSSDMSYSDACYFTGKEIARTMKDDGYFIVTSDVSTFEEGVEINSDFFISMRKMIKSYEDAGLKLFGDVSLPAEIYRRRMRLGSEEEEISVARLVFVKNNH
tara:strand:+ start:120 stop:944 length:825 start_codon:yes stop_codon:yes gene_type:complete